jgi:biofilm protein TabA
MILDHIDNSAFYFAQHPLFEKAFAFLQQLKESDFDSAKLELDGDRLFALFFKGDGKGAEKIVMESHKKYIDIQFVFMGEDLMGHRALSQCHEVNKEYVVADDYMLFNDQPSTQVLVREKYFTVFYPADVHAPLIGKKEMHKVVVKVAL